METWFCKLVVNWILGCWCFTQKWRQMNVSSQRLGLSKLNDWRSSPITKKMYISIKHKKRREREKHMQAWNIRSKTYNMHLNEVIFNIVPNSRKPTVCDLHWLWSGRMCNGVYQATLEKCKWLWSWIHLNCTLLQLTSLFPYLNINSAWDCVTCMSEDQLERDRSPAHLKELLFNHRALCYPLASGQTVCTRHTTKLENTYDVICVCVCACLK